jgi:hypothetical protein
VCASSCGSSKASDILAETHTLGCCAVSMLTGLATSSKSWYVPALEQPACIPLCTVPCLTPVLPACPFPFLQCWDYGKCWHLPWQPAEFTTALMLWNLGADLATPVPHTRRWGCTVKILLPPT